MAAVLCKGCSDICSGCCKICCSIPCKICTVPCRLCGEFCNIVAEGISHLCNNPFCAYVLVATGLNIPAIVGGVITIFNGLHEQNGLFGCKIYIWQIVNIVLCLTNILAAFYIAIRFNQLRRNPTASSSGRNTQSSGLKKASDILCHDPIVAIYILVLIGFFIWLCIGVGWNGNGDFACADDGSLNLLDSSFGTGFSFFFLGFNALVLSVCCSCCCYNQDERGPNHYYSQNRYGSTGNNNGRPPPATTTTNQAYMPYNDVEYTTASASAPSPVAAIPVPGSNSKVPVNETPIQATVVEPSPSAPPLSSLYDNNLTGAATSGLAAASKIGNILGTKASQGLKKVQKLAADTMKK